MVSTDRGTVAVVDHELLPFIEAQWQKLPKKMRPLADLIALPVPKKQETFLEFVEKLAILDVIFEPYLEENFMQYDRFPYDPKGFLGNETAILNVLTFWQHYQNKYMDQMGQAAALEDAYREWITKEGQLLPEEEKEFNK